MSCSQASGDNILAAVKAFTDVLSSREVDMEENAVFFDVLGRVMVSSFSTALQIGLSILEGA